MKKIRLLNRATTLLIALAVVFGIAFGAVGVEDLPDAQIENAVDDALIGDSATPADEIVVEISDGIVTLSGSVNSILAKDRAEKLAETVKGVRGIINQIDVEPPYRTDTEINEDIRDALLLDPVTESWEVTSSVMDGKVELSGAVESWQEKKLVGKVVKGVRGVKGVDNNISINYEMDRGDVEIEEEIQAALRWNAYIDDVLIEVEVDDAEVELDGTVGSLAEKQAAYREAWVTGVDDVENELEVESWARDERFRKDKYVDMADSEIEDAIQDAFLYDPRVNVFEITAEIDEGYVTLRGTVDNLKAKRSAAQDARRIVGVWGVNNRIKVAADEKPSDSKIVRNVKDALLWNPYVDRHEIDVNVVDNEVYLYGDVDSNFEKAEADDVASTQAGVEQVHNYLAVQTPTDVAFGTYDEDWYLGDYDWYTTAEFTSPQEDWELEKDIENELFWSPFVDEDEVEVNVEDGVAELTGTVDSWNERQAATENAWEAGAGVVDNELTVNYGPDYYTP